MAIVSAVLWLIWLFVWLYSDFGDGIGISAWEILGNWATNKINYLIYFVLITLFAIWMAMILVGFLRKSLRKSLLILVLSSLIWFVLFSLGYKSFNPDFCDCNHDYLGITFRIFSLLFIVLWFISLFYVIKYLTNSNKRWTIVLLIWLGIVGVLVVQTSISCSHLISPFKLSRLDCLKGLLRGLFRWVFLIISIILCIVAWVKRYKENRKSE